LNLELKFYGLFVASSEEERKEIAFEDVVDEGEENYVNLNDVIIILEVNYLAY